MFLLTSPRSRRALTLALSLQLALLGAAPTASAYAAARRTRAARAQNPTPPAPQPSPADAKPQTPATPAPAQAAPSPQGTPQPEKPFADVVKDAEVVKGLFTLYRKDDKVLVEIQPDQFDKIYLLSPTMESGIGERGFLSAQVLPEFAYSFKRQGKSVQLLAKNVNYRATDNKVAIRRAVERSFADSVVGTAKFESQPHPERKSVLIDLSNFLLTDLPMLGYALEATYRIPYRLDKNSSTFAGVKAFPDNVEIETMLNYATERPPLPPLGPSPVPMPRPPLAPPDLRSLQFRVRYSLSKIPETSYRPRLADDRVGHFATLYQDFSDDRSDSPYVRFINRWHLEKSDPSAPLSTPKKPIVFWLENAIPDKYRQAIADGVLMWNKAFERVGFKDAVVVKQQPDDSDWDPADVRYSSIRWFIATDAGFAIGPSRANPFTGEIYDADISFSESMTRYVRSEFQEKTGPLGESAPNGLEILQALRGRFGMCNYAGEAVREANFGFQMLSMRGTLAGSEAEEQYVREFLTHVTAHEVGHTLGLRHNFRASNLIPYDKLQDTALTDEMGLTGSVMDYTPVNIAPRGVKQGRHWQTTLGTYDYWAIEYAYKPLAASTPEGERAELNKIASRVADSKLAYGTDEDVFGNDPVGIDPRANRWDFAADPLPWYEGRAKLVHELWDNLETKVAQPGKGYQRLRFAFNGGFGELATAMLSASKYVGGIYHNRDHVGDPGGRAPYEPVAAKDQRRALALINTYAFGADAFRISPRLLNKLAIDRDWTFEGDIWRLQRLDYPIHARVLALHRSLLDRLYHPILLSRMQDLEVKYENPRDAFRMSELFEGLQSAVWSELKSPAGAVEVNSFRRNLQREHVKRLQRLVLRQDAQTPEDASTLARHDLTQLRAQIKQALAAPAGRRMSMMTRAHLQETAARIDETLNAQQTRTVN
ncbi:MAG TPA: zinc-dependent metalloprotease [Pyrinomonadaceae bacterium]|jgi:hypothetical protein|nr:zinc-dependent metalloprotease [Pyrinomonadaceae bacterium]